VREVDEVHQPERDRQSAGQHEQQHAVGDAVEQVGEDSGHAMGTEATGRLTAIGNIYDVMAGLVPAIHVFVT